MSFYRKKPVVIEAVQWFKHGDHTSVSSVPMSHEEGLFMALESGIPLSCYGWCPTLEGGHIVTPGDWVITGIKGEFYPCKPDIFELTYEQVDAARAALEGGK
jgi:hypothetical protein